VDQSLPASSLAMTCSRVTVSSSRDGIRVSYPGLS
jgi:hypothetical protein